MDSTQRMYVYNTAIVAVAILAFVLTVGFFMVSAGQSNDELRQTEVKACQRAVPADVVKCITQTQQ